MHPFFQRFYPSCHQEARTSVREHTIPPGIRLVRVNPSTGLVARAGDRDVIWEAFKPGSEPMVLGPVLDGGAMTSDAAAPAPIPARDAGGLY